MDESCIHLYWGEGKGKTTAAMGLALRALGQGLSVVIVQFLKDGQSGELDGLKRLGAIVFSGNPSGKFTFQMDENERRETYIFNTEMLRHAMEESCELLILDEICSAWELEMVDHELARQAVLKRPMGCEVVLTGHNPANWMFDIADYNTEMCCHKHPYERGLMARKGVEF